MSNYPEASQGLRKMFIAEIGAIFATIIGIIPIIGIIGAIAAIVFAVISIIGLNQAGKEIEGCKKALYLTIANIVVNLLGNIKVLSGICGIVDAIISLAIVYFVCTSVAAVLQSEGHAGVAAKGQKVWNINLVCTIISVICSILAIIPLINIIAGIITFIVAIVSIYAAILYLIFLKQSSEALA